MAADMREEVKHMAATVLTTREIAERLDTDQKTLRKFFRSESSPVERVGQGNRYAVTAGEVKTIRKAFEAWRNAHARKQAA
jgi:hypothetical protein